MTFRMFEEEIEYGFVRFKFLPAAVSDEEFH